MRKILSAIIVAMCSLTASPASKNLQQLDSLANTQTNIDSIIKYASAELELAIEQERLPERAKAQLMLAQCHYQKNNIDKSMELAKYALEIFNLQNDTLRQAQCYNLLGITSALKGSSGTADGLFNRSLELYKAIDRKPAEAEVYRNMGKLCLRYNVYDRAFEYFSRALDIDMQLNYKAGIAQDQYCIGYGQLLQCVDEDGSISQLSRAKAELFKSLSFGNSSHQLNVYCALADTYLHQAKMSRGRIQRQAIDSSLQCISICNRLIKQTGATGFSRKIDLRKARYTIATGDYVTSNQMLQKLLSEVEENTEGYLSLNEELYKAFAELYEKTGNYKQAFDYQKKINEQNLRKNSDGYLINSTQTKIQTEYDEEMKMREHEEQKKEIAFATKSAHFKMMLTVVIAALMVFLFGLIIIYNSNRRRRKDNMLLNEQNLKLEKQQAEILKQNELLSQKNEEIEEQRNEIEGQRNYLSSQNKMMSNANRQITDSILYAKRIQEAAVPSEKMMQSIFGECLVFWRPLNIVSGDFYWATQIGNHKMLAVADCTGHGVPGAFMSMLGISLLNDIVASANLATVTAAQILNDLRKRLKESLRQTGKPGEADDGIDLAFCIFNSESTTMQYAGAFRPLIIIRNNELIEYKADKMPCGVYINEMESFTNNIIEIQKGDVLYMYSDGIADQFSGGHEMRKFTIRRMKEMLIEQHSNSFDQQKLLIGKTIDDWRKPASGHGKHADQVDDILLVGLRIE